MPECNALEGRDLEYPRAGVTGGCKHLAWVVGPELESSAFDLSQKAEKR